MQKLLNAIGDALIKLGKLLGGGGGPIEPK